MIVGDQEEMERLEEAKALRKTRKELQS
jgi:hypothetical protein